MNDHPATGSYLFDDGLNKIAKHVRLAVRIIRPASSDHIDEPGRSQDTKRRRIVRGSVVGEAYDRLEAGGSDLVPGHPLGELHTS
jgi:hypothetical protein